MFGHRLQAQVAKRGERVLMDVEVSGIPDPTVTWYKNNQLLDPAEYKVKKSGNNYTLVIEKGKAFWNSKIVRSDDEWANSQFLAGNQDAGKYMVRAVNAGGEAQSIADFIVLEPTPERMIEIVKTVKIENVDGQTVSDCQKSTVTCNFPSFYWVIYDSKI